MNRVRIHLVALRSVIHMVLDKTLTVTLMTNITLILPTSLLKLLCTIPVLQRTRPVLCASCVLHHVCATLRKQLDTTSDPLVCDVIALFRLSGMHFSPALCSCPFHDTTSCRSEIAKERAHGIVASLASLFSLLMSSSKTRVPLLYTIVLSHQVTQRARV